jgi:hypothetical protein
MPHFVQQILSLSTSYSQIATEETRFLEEQEGLKD